MLGVLEQILQAADGLDLGQVDEGLDGLALAEVEAKRPAVVEAVLVSEPEPEQPPRRRRRAADSPARAKRRRAARTPLTAYVPSLGLRRSGTA